MNRHCLVGQTRPSAVNALIPFKNIFARGRRLNWQAI